MLILINIFLLVLEMSDAEDYDSEAGSDAGSGSYQGSEPASPQGSETGSVRRSARGSEVGSPRRSARGSDSEQEVSNPLWSGIIL